MNDKTIESILARLILDPSQESTPQAREQASREALTMKQAAAELKSIFEAAMTEVVGGDANFIERDSYGNVTMYDEVADNQNGLRNTQRQRQAQVIERLFGEEK